MRDKEEISEILLFKKKYKEGPSLWNRLHWFWLDIKRLWYEFLCRIGLRDNDNYIII